MSVLAALARAYTRLPDAPPFGYSTEKIGLLVSLHEDGTVAHAVDMRGDDRKRSPRMMEVPRAVKRASGIAPNFLWDKTAYALGVTAGEGKRTAQEHATFRERHAEWLAGTDDPGLLALLRFLDAWDSQAFQPPLWPEEMRDQNLVFCLERERLAGVLLHDRPAARAAWARVVGETASDPQICLVTGEPGPVARLHASIKGVWGAQSSGASLVSFNLDAFESYGHAQGDNAPVSEAAAFAYGTALNIFLAKDSGHRIQVGDASTVFWADCADMEAASESEAIFAGLIDPAAEEQAGARLVAEKLEAIRQGRPLAEIYPRLADKGLRFFVLGLAPNAARLAIRFYAEDDFGAIAARYQRFLREMAIDPPPRGTPGLWRYLSELAVQGKRENVPPNLAGDWMRAILSGAPYPLTLLSTAVLRARSDQEVGALRAAMMKSVLLRNYEMEVPVALDEDNPSPAYQLGRLFAVLEGAQYAALGRVNAPIGDRYYAAASSTPARVFAALLRGLKVHVADARKRGKGGWIEPRVAGIMARLPADLPRTLRLEDQARFAIGYYHEKGQRFAQAGAEVAETPAEPSEGASE